MFQLIKKVWNIFQPFHKAIRVILAFEVLIQLIQLAPPYFYGKALSSVLSSSTHSFEFTLVLIVLSYAARVISNVVGWAKGQYEVKYFEMDTNRYLAMKTAQKLFSFSIGQHRNEHTGLTQSVISDGQSAMTDLINMGVYQAFPILLSLPIAAAAVLWLSIPVGIVVIIGFIIYLVVSISTNKRFMPEIQKDREVGQGTRKRWYEATNHAPIVSIQGAEIETARDLDARYDIRVQSWKHVFGRYATARRFGTGMVIDTFQVLSFGTAAYFAYLGKLEVGSVLTIMLWVNRAFNEMGTLNSIQRNLLDAQSRATKYFALLDMPSDVVEISEPVPANFIRGTIELRDVGFKYSERNYIPKFRTQKKKNPRKNVPLRGINLTIEAGQHVAFVGPSGAGKSTTALLLLRGQDPDFGKILIDGIDLRDLDLSGYRRKIGVVEQEIHLFDDSLRHNISLGLGENRLLTNAELDRLAAITRIDQFVEDLDDGWDTWIGENGVQLSGGQKQRVAIARALASDPTILLFDEATSSLDVENEAHIKNAIASAVKGRTAIFIAHRLSTIRDADKIFVFSEGLIEASGTHEELLTTSSTYKKLVSLQTEQFI